MINYKVHSGDMDITVKAKNPRSAAIKALKKTKAKLFGLMIEITPENDEIVYASTEWIFKEMGVVLKNKPSKDYQQELEISTQAAEVGK